jgi:hypothetical protein
MKNASAQFSYQISTIPKVNLFSNRDPQSNPIPNPIGCLDPILAIAKLKI